MASPDNTPHFDPELEQAIAEVENSLHTLQQRYAQIQRDSLRQHELQKQASVLQDEPKTQEIKNELKNIQEQLDSLEVNLESRLFTLGSLKEPFWQAVRFGGLGIVIGWILKTIAG